MQKTNAQLAAEAAASGSRTISQSMSGKNWTIDMQKQLIVLSGEGKKLTELATIFSRSEKAVQAKLFRIGTCLYKSSSHLNLNLGKISAMLGVDKNLLSRFRSTLGGKAIRGNLALCRNLLGVEAVSSSKKNQKKEIEPKGPKEAKAMNDAEKEAKKLQQTKLKEERAVAIVARKEEKAAAIAANKEKKAAAIAARKEERMKKAAAIAARKEERMKKTAEKAKLGPGSRKIWTDAELANLFQQSELRLSLEEIAAKHKRPQKAVARQIIIINPGAAEWYLPYIAVS